MKLFDDTILKDAIDIHIHVGPDYMPRYADAITLAEEARAAGMRAIVVKCHLTSTVGSAQAARLVVPEVHVVGSITLNTTVGGLNPRAVMAAVLSGAKVVWLPTVDARYGFVKAEQGHWIGHYVHSSSFGYRSQELSVTDENGHLLPEMHEILRICSEKRVALCSGHISPVECLAVAREAQRTRFSQFEITHVNAWTEDFTLDVMKELTSYGAVLSLSYGVCSPRNGRQDPEEIAHIIREVGPQNCIMMTDYGQTVSPPPVEGLRVFYYLMKALGVEPAALDLMIRENPAKLLNLG
jgi:hypothetical protein